MTRRRGARHAGATLLTVVLLTGAWPGLNAPAEAQFAAASNMNPMNHGPFVSSTITLDPWSVRGIIVHKGIAVKVGPEATMVFDTDLLRIAGAWTGGVLHWLPARDGLQEWPTPDGHLHFVNAEKAGWSNRGCRGESVRRPGQPASLCPPRILHRAFCETLFKACTPLA